MQTNNIRTETDLLGSMSLPREALYGIHTARAAANFSLSGERMDDMLIRALAEVKLACARTNHAQGHLESSVAEAIAEACSEIRNGGHHESFVVDALQGGAGTSANMNCNEVVANRASQLLGHVPGSYVVHPLHHVNLHQSTNDVFPTAVRVAALHKLHSLETAVSALQEHLQGMEQTYADVVKVARTQLQDAVPMTFGMTFGAWAEAVARDRWRIFKCRERIRQVNLGGTVIGTGLGAPRDYILHVAQELKQVTGLRLARAENLVDATQNTDSLVEVSGMLKTCAATLLKLCSDIRLLASGPHCGLGELRIPAVQAGSTAMPGKVNPVIAEAVSQAALRIIHNDGLITAAGAQGTLELNQFMPLMAHTLLQSLSLLTNAAILLRTRCLDGAEPDTQRCAQHVSASRATAALLVPHLGYERTERLLARSVQERRPFAEVVAHDTGLSPEAVTTLLAPGNLRQLGFTHTPFTQTSSSGATDAPCTAPDGEEPIS